jgi:hypothetical protein
VPLTIRRGIQKKEDVLGSQRISVARVKHTKTQENQKQSKQSKPNKKESEVKLQLAKNSPPRAGAQPIVQMYLSVPGQNVFCVRTMFDTSAAIPIISSKLITERNLPMITHDVPLRINGADGRPLSGAGEAFTHSLLLQYKRHYTRETFEIMPLESETHIILPSWWMAKHQPNTFWGKLEEITLDSAFCKQHCTKAAAQDISLTMDKDILHHYDAIVIGYVASVNPDTAEVDPTTIIQEKFQQYIKVLGKELADKLPDDKPYDHAIDLKDGEQPPWGPMYPLNEMELQALRDYLKEMLEFGKIRPSKSPTAAPIIFVPKAHGRGLRLCVDDRGLNKVTIANRYPLLIMSELQDRVRGAKIFTKIDLKNVYNLIRIKPGDEWKTAFKTRYGLYEYTIMPFGLSNAPVTFENMMNHIF